MSHVSCIMYHMSCVMCHVLRVIYGRQKFKTTVTVTEKFLKVEIDIYQGLSKHQEVCFNPVTKVEKFIVIFWDLFGAI